MTRSTIVLNFVLWPAMQMSLARLFVALPNAWFRTSAKRPARHGELRLYRALNIRAWKRWLPDGEGWVGGGFSKKSLHHTQRAYLERFVVETCRGEATHWAAIACSFLFFLWNPPFTWPGLILLAFALNGPCIAVQRYNRTMLVRWLHRN